MYILLHICARIQHTNTPLIFAFNLNNLSWENAKYVIVLLLSLVEVCKHTCTRGYFVWQLFV